MIRQEKSDDQTALLDLAVATKLFQPDELGELEGMLTDYFNGTLGDDQSWIVDDEGGVRGAAYYAPEMMSDGTWNLYFIGVHPDQQGQGRGTSLLNHVEQALIAQGQRMLLVETSGLGRFEQTRAFYRKNGYDEEARIRDFYATGDDKIVFRRVLTN